MKLSLFDHIKERYPEAVERDCHDEGNRLKRGRAGQILILHGNCLGVEGQSICDCIVFKETSNGIIIVIVELKSKTIDPKHAIKQLNGCYSFVRDMLRMYRAETGPVSYRFAIFAEKRTTYDMKLIRRAEIGGESIATKKYSDTLGSLLS